MGMRVNRMAREERILELAALIQTCNHRVRQAVLDHLHKDLRTHNEARAEAEKRNAQIKLEWKTEVLRREEVHKIDAAKQRITQNVS